MKAARTVSDLYRAMMVATPLDLPTDASCVYCGADGMVPLVRADQDDLTCPACFLHHLECQGEDCEHGQVFFEVYPAVTGGPPDNWSPADYDSADCSTCDGSGRLQAEDLNADAATCNLWDEFRDLAQDAGRTGRVGVAL